MTELVPWAVVATVFVGMLALCWRALSALDKQAKVLADIIAGKMVNYVPVTSAAVLPKPVAPAIDPADVVDQGLVNFIKKQEAFSSKAYWDYKQYSIGYGTKANSPTEVIDEAEATRRLMNEVLLAEKEVEKIAPHAPKGVKQALTDLTYNAGAGWQDHSLGALVKAGDWEGAKKVILQYNHAGGHENAGLTARREAEVKWFENPL